MKPRMKKVLKALVILLLILVLLAAGAAFWLFSTLKKELGDHWQDYANAFTLQTAAGKSLPPLAQIRPPVHRRGTGAHRGQ